MSCIWSRSTCAIPVFSWQETSSPVYVRNMELREKYGMWLSECKVSLYKQTLHTYIYPEFPNNRVTLSDSLYISQKTIFNLWYRFFLFISMERIWKIYVLYLSNISILFMTRIWKKAIYYVARVGESKLSFAFIKLEKMSIDRSLLFETFYEVQSIKRDRPYTAVYTRYYDTSTCSIRILLARSNNGHVA